MNKLPQNFELVRYGLHVRLVREEDAEFIVSLRTNTQLSRYISHTDNDIHKQLDWIKEYKRREKNGLEYYFLYEYNGEPFAVNRIYNISEDRAITGSWVVKPNTDLPQMFATILIEREIYFEDLDFENDYFTVDKANVHVCKLHRMLGAAVIDENDKEYFFIQTKDAFFQNSCRFIKLLGLQK